MWNAVSFFKHYRRIGGVSSMGRALPCLAAGLVLVGLLAWLGADAAAAEDVRLPGVPSPEMAKLFTPRHARIGTYQVTLLTDGIGGAVRLVKVAIAPDAGPDDPAGAWRVQQLDPLEAFGTAGVYDRSRLARLYAGRRVSIVRGPVERHGAVVAAVTLISPHPDATLSRLEPGTLAILLRVPE
jgi:hypothetical protein